MFSDYVSSKGSARKSGGSGHPTEFTPQPTEEDYQEGFITRYFAKQKRKPRKIVEINEKQFKSHDKIQKGLSQDLYEIFSLRWKISGSRNDIYKKGIPVTNGVEDTNKRNLEIEEERHPGIKKLLDDPLEFWEKRKNNN